MKIYVVTSGSYSDYCIEKIFINKDKAEYFSKWCRDSQVEEYETSDEDIVAPGYKVSFNYDFSGNKPPYINIQKSTVDSAYPHYTLFDDYRKYSSGKLGIRGSRFIPAINYKGDDYTKEKYTKVCYDLSAQIKQWLNEGLNEDQINDILYNNT